MHKLHLIIKYECTFYYRKCVHWKIIEFKMYCKFTKNDGHWFSWAMVNSNLIKYYYKFITSALKRLNLRNCWRNIQILTQATVHSLIWKQVLSLYSQTKSILANIIQQIILVISIQTFKFTQNIHYFIVHIDFRNIIY